MEPEILLSGRNPLFEAVRQELSEELGISSSEIAAMLCRGLVLSLSDRKPELVFETRVNLAWPEILKRHARALDRHEHGELIAVPAGPADLQKFLEAYHGEFTPPGLGFYQATAIATYQNQTFNSTTQFQVREPVLAEVPTEIKAFEPTLIQNPDSWILRNLGGRVIIDLRTGKFSAGDEVLVHAGVHFTNSDTLDIDISGTPDAPIVIRAAGDGKTFIDGGSTGITSRPISTAV